MTSQLKKDQLKKLLNTDEPEEAELVLKKIRELDPGYTKVSENVWGLGGNPCERVYHLPKFDIYVKLTGIHDQWYPGENNGDKGFSWHRSFICKKLVKKESYWEKDESEAISYALKTKPKIPVFKSRQNIIDMVLYDSARTLNMLKTHGTDQSWLQVFFEGNLTDETLVKCTEDTNGYNEEGENGVYKIFHVKPYDLFIRIFGSYDSYNYDHNWNQIELVKKQEREIVHYV